ncbi:hypothetical protein E4U31_002366 [Claviceps sp. LM219 group G6]|nr:hypothetical protein E4U31_002366 [Claviceps sp. LM219 group G6]
MKLTGMRVWRRIEWASNTLVIFLAGLDQTPETSRYHRNSVQMEYQAGYGGLQVVQNGIHLAGMKAVLDGKTSDRR